jgi:hypothetical protein
MRTLILTLLLLVGLGLNAMEASAFKNEPDGFKDMKWGTAANQLFSKDEFVGISSDDKSFKYQKISDTIPLEVDNVNLYSTVYSFYNGKFWKVEVEARLLQAGKLLNVFIAKYGEPSRVADISEFSREYIWSGTTTEIILTTSLNFFDKKTADIATASMFSRNIRSAIDDNIDHSPAERKSPIDAVDGFRGRKWGSGFNKSITYLPLEQEPFFEYLIKNDDLLFEGIRAQEIRYRFLNNRSLQKVELFFSGKQNYSKLKEACFKLFGTTSRFGRDEIRWIGKNTTVSLTFSIDAKGEWQSRLNYLGFGTQ